MNQKPLILGASGFLGGYLKRHFTESYFHTASSNSTDYTLRKSLETHKDILELFRHLDIKVVINAIGFTDIENCEKYKDKATWLNCDLPKLFALECLKREIKFVHYSTDAVFDGAKAFAKETDFTMPKSFYGFSKLEGEKKVLTANKNTLILRVNFFGNSNKRSLFNYFYKAGLENEKVIGFSDVYFTTLYAEDVARITHQLARLDKIGIFHLVGSERLTKYEFGRKIYKVFGFDEAKIESGYLTSDVTLNSAVRSLDLSLSNSKLLKQGVYVPSIENGLKRLKVEVCKNDKE